MVHIQEDKLIIEINHPCPDEFLSDIRNSIIHAVQYQSEDSLDTALNLLTKITLLEILKNI